MHSAGIARSVNLPDLLQYVQYLGREVSMALKDFGENRQLEQFLLSRLAKREVTDLVHKYTKPYK